MCSAEDQLLEEGRIIPSWSMWSNSRRVTSYLCPASLLGLAATGGDNVMRHLVLDWQFGVPRFGDLVISRNSARILWKFDSGLKVQMLHEDRSDFSPRTASEVTLSLRRRSRTLTSRLKWLRTSVPRMAILTSATMKSHRYVRLSPMSIVIE